MSWIKTCILYDIVPDTGVCALIAGRQIAIFRVGERAYAIDNIDPFSRAGVLSRGIVGDKQGVLVVASPLYKQAFALDSGECIDEPGRAVATYPTRVTSGVVEVYVDAMVEPRGEQVMEPRGEQVMEPRGEQVMEPRGQALSVA